MAGFACPRESTCYKLLLLLLNMAVQHTFRKEKSVIYAFLMNVPKSNSTKMMVCNAEIAANIFCLHLTDFILIIRMQQMSTFL